MKVSRALHLSVYGNQGKLESARYTCKNYKEYLQHWTNLLFFKPDQSFSTKGMGQLANKAQKKARGIIKAQREAAKVTGQKTNIPDIKFTSCPAGIDLSEDSIFDYWISFEDPFSKKRIRIPSKSHKRLKHFLRLGWALNPVGELVLQKNGNWQARVYMQKEVAKASPKESSLGVDVGLTHCVSRSDGYLGVSARKIIRKWREKNKERQRQGHKKVQPSKSNLKQQLDVEARRAINVCKLHRLSLIVEDPKVLANLSQIHMWARSYFAERCFILGQEEEVFVWTEHPAYTSQTDYKCGYRHKANRVKSRFKCLGCGSSTHADINAARVIALKGSLSIADAIQSGRLKMTELDSKGHEDPLCRFSS